MKWFAGIVILAFLFRNGRIDICKKFTELEKESIICVTNGKCNQESKKNAWSYQRVSIM